MKLVTAVIFAALCVATFAEQHYMQKKLVCYWNSTSFQRYGPGKFQIDDLRPALSLCTHLVYGYAGINTVTHEATVSNPHLDTGAGYAFYRTVTQMKKIYPHLKVYLSIGGNADHDDETHKYLTVTETKEARTKFVNSVGRLLSEYDFDGVDLAWQFPTTEVKKDRGVFGGMWHGFRKVFGYGKFKDEKEAEHRDGFTILVRDLKNHLRWKNHKEVVLTVVPHVNSSIYYDVRSLVPNIDAVHIFAFDQKSPDRNPKDADHAAPIYGSYGRVPDENLDFEVRYWLAHGTPGPKIIVGVPTYARTWKLTSESQISGVPPITADGPGAPGPHTQIPGLLSYTEICTRLRESSVGYLRHVNDPSKKYGSYAYQSYNYKTGSDGVWLSYESPDSAGNKAAYAKAKGLGGVAIVDLSLDDFRGFCTGDKYPIVKAVRYKL